jgi:hypothetical protein
VPALGAAPAIVNRLRIVAVADVCPAADRACVNFHHVPLVAAARPPDLLLRAKDLFVEAKASPQTWGRWLIQDRPGRLTDTALMAIGETA